MPLPILPTDLQLEIFSYLPCKEIGKFMVLSKLHHSLFIAPDFISKHHSNSKSRNKFVVLLASIISSLCDNDAHLRVRQNLMFPEFVYHDLNNIIGISNGIICLQTHSKILFINPIIRCYFDFPYFEDDEVYCSYGFITTGLSHLLVVKIDSNQKYYCSSLDYDDDESNDDDSIGYGDDSIPRSSAWLYTYTVDDGGDDEDEVDDEDENWKPVEIPDCVICIKPSSCFPNFALNNGVVYSGILHWGAKKWVGNSWKYFILTFSPKSRVFGELELSDSLATPPCYPEGESGVFVVQMSTKPLTVYALICSGDMGNYTAAVWVMDMYGVKESWNQIFSFDWSDRYISSTLFGFDSNVHMNIGIPFLIFHRADDTLLFHVKLNGKCSLRCLDISREASTVLTHNVSRTMETFYIGYFSESLVFLNEVEAEFLSRY